MSHRAFSKAEAERRQQQVQEKRSSTSPTGYCFVMNNNTANRYEEGYLIREIPIKSLNIEEATPPVAELQAFNQVGFVFNLISGPPELLHMYVDCQCLQD